MKGEKERTYTFVEVAEILDREVKLATKITTDNIFKNFANEFGLDLCLCENKSNFCDCENCQRFRKLKNKYEQETGVVERCNKYE